jgi:nitrogen fixation protein NifU and related proteins
MTSDDLRTLYRDVIVDHSRHPRNFRTLEVGRKADGFNPLCGDRLTVYVQIDNGVIKDVSFEGLGCAIAIASASLMTESVRGRTVAEADALFARVEQMIAASPDATVDELGDLSALVGVRRFPVRMKCATLPWQALRAAAAAGDQLVTTE